MFVISDFQNDQINNRMSIFCPRLIFSSKRGVVCSDYSVKYIRSYSIHDSSFEIPSIFSADLRICGENSASIPNFTGSTFALEIPFLHNFLRKSLGGLHNHGYFIFCIRIVQIKPLIFEKIVQMPLIDFVWSNFFLEY